MDQLSFHVLHQGRELLLRLIFMNCPVSNVAFPERVAEAS